ncbi:MAG TPA: LptA/OstA family protein [Steroidobacteraceae bacterium]|jgi:lipopolysaccharide transport protein LptA|nr:LptA/OstA family protein [Steroidobacteraceae bacterium]
MAASSSRRLAAAVLAACATVAGAQEREQLPIQLKAASLNFDTQKGLVEYGAVTITQGEIRITADRAVTSGLDFKDSSWEFSGTVRISMPDSALASDTASVHFSGGEIASALVTGAPATFQQQRKDERAEGRANRIDYDLKRGAVELDGNAWLSDGKTEITGAKLVYSTTNQRVVSREQVLITIQPNEPAPEKPKPKP